MAYVDRIADCNNADLRDYVRWQVPGSTVGGFVRRDRVPLLRGPESAFGAAEPLALLGSDFASRSARMAASCRDLAARGEFSLRGELYPVVAAFADAPLLQIDRAAVPFFGVRPFGVHLCAYVREPRGMAVWVAVRAPDKTFPNRWDNTVAGGQPIGLSLAANLAKECAEEAGIPSELAARAVPTSTLTYVRADPTGLKPDTLFCYDLELPPEFVPRPHDGEVAEFLRLPLQDVIAAVRDTDRCKPNCALVWIDFFLRHGALDTELDAAARAALARDLRAPLP